MTYTKFGTLVASVGVIAFALASHEASARPAGASRGAAVTARPVARPFAAHSFRNRRGNFGSFFWPGFDDDTFYGSNGYGSDGAVTGVAPSPSSDVHYTYDVPWDWAHRYPPTVAPSDRPYVRSCTAEPVTVPGSHGGEQVVNVTRCY